MPSDIELGKRYADRTLRTQRRIAVANNADKDSLARTQADGSFRAVVISARPNGTVDVRAQSEDGGFRIIRNARPTLGGYPLSVGDPVQIWRDTDGAINCQALDGGELADGVRDSTFLGKVAAVYRVTRYPPGQSGEADEAPDLVTRMDLQPLKRRNTLIHALASTESLSVDIGDVLWVSRDDGGAVDGVADEYPPNYIAGAGARLPADYYNGTEPRPVLSLDRYADIGAIGTDAVRAHDIAYDGLITSIRLQVGGDPARTYPTPADPDALPPVEGLPRPRPLQPIIWDTGVSVVSNAPVSGTMRIQTRRNPIRLQVSAGFTIEAQTRPAPTDSVPNPPHEFSFMWARHVSVIYIDAYSPSIVGATRYIVVVNRGNPYG